MDNHKVRLLATFDKCPHCGGKRRAAESVAQEQKQKGLIRPEVEFVLVHLGGPVVDAGRLDRMFVGQKVPAVLAYVDVCLDCGALYAVKVERQEAELSAGPLPQPPGFSAQ